MAQQAAKKILPPRFAAASVLQLVVSLAVLAGIIKSFEGVGISVSELVSGLPDMWRVLGEMLPPDLSRLEAVFWRLLETFQMAVAGTVLGVVLSFPFAVLAARNVSPHPVVYYLARTLISLFRTIPDLIWALFFVVTVGIGAFAGALTIMVESIGFCGRFFAEAMEEVDPGPSEALTAIGAGPSGLVFCSVAPAAMPSFINTSLFNLEKATRSSVVLGLVGAGGIGIELKVAMDMFRYAEAATIILCIFVLVLIVERAGAFVRRRIL
ncbi:MAG: phosphonate ABC transporter, permease protein PhnE [Bdellovibrionales bacterium]|nr:phosphonate ABC transporter, permease protein PhnE [Bdellovibrionales bacterium]